MRLAIYLLLHLHKPCGMLNIRTSYIAGRERPGKYV